MKNILVPCDFSRPAEEAFKFAVDIARQSGGNIHVLHVIDITFLRASGPVSNSFVFNADFLKEVEKGADAKFQALWERYAPMTMPIKFRHVLSSLTQEIESYISSNKIDLVVMGTHGKGDAALGSNTQKVVRACPVPVLAVRSAPGSIKNIVLPLLPDLTNDRFIQKVKELQYFFQATLHIIYINTPLFFQNDSDSTNELKAFALKAQLSDYTINVRADFSVEDGVVRFVKEIDADMIAMGTHGWKGVAHFFLGSTAEYLIHNLKVPIWTHCLV